MSLIWHVLALSDLGKAMDPSCFFFHITWKAKKGPLEKFIDMYEDEVLVHTIVFS